MNEEQFNKDEENLLDDYIRTLSKLKDLKYKVIKENKHRELASKTQSLY